MGSVVGGRFVAIGGNPPSTGGGGGGSGDVVGPASSTDNAIARFNGAGGKTIQNSSVTISDTGSITQPAGQTINGRDVSADGTLLDAVASSLASHLGAGGGAHALASGSDAGFMSSGDFTKLAGIETNADVTDAANVAAAGAVMDTDYAGAYEGDQIRTGVGAYAVVKHNRAAVAAPTAANDNTQDYAVGSRWFDTTADRAYVCLDASTGSAVWREVSIVADAVAGVGAVMDSDFAGTYPADLTRTGAGTYAGLRNNLAASTSPSATDDSSSDYAVGSRWIDTTADRAWTCVDATPGAAVWIEGGTAGGGVRVVGARGWSTSNFLSAAGALAGADNYTLAVLLHTGRLQALGATTPQTVAASGNRLSEGLSIFLENNRLWAERANGGTKATMGGHRWFAPAGDTSHAASAWLDDKTVLLVLRHTGDGSTGVFDSFMNGLLQATFATSGAWSPSTGSGYIGRQTNAVDACDAYLSICAWADIASALTDAQLYELFRYVRRNGDLPAGLFTNRHSIASLGLGDGDALPATVPAVEGALTWALSGALTVDVTSALWV